MFQLFGLYCTTAFRSQPKTLSEAMRLAQNPFAWPPEGPRKTHFCEQKSSHLAEIKTLDYGGKRVKIIF